MALKRLNLHCLLIAVCLIAISSCGFHLRGSDSLTSSFDTLSIRAADNNDFVSELTRVAQTSGITLTEEAEWQIDVKKPSRTRQRISSSQSASADNFEITLSVDFSLRHRMGDKDTLYGPITAKRSTLLQDNQDNVGSVANEETILVSELQKLLARQVLRQAEIIAANPPDCDCDNEAQTTATQ